MANKVMNLVVDFEGDDRAALCRALEEKRAELGYNFALDMLSTVKKAHAYLVARSANVRTNEDLAAYREQQQNGRVIVVGNKVGRSRNGRTIWILGPATWRDTLFSLGRNRRSWHDVAEDIFELIFRHYRSKQQE